MEPIPEDLTQSLLGTQCSMNLDLILKIMKLNIKKETFQQSFCSQPRVRLTVLFYL